MDVTDLVKVMQTVDGDCPVQSIYEWEDTWNQYIQEKGGEYLHMSVSEAIPRMISALNYQERKHCNSCSELGIRIKVGDIAFIDFGEAYLNEVGFQHFGLILKLYHKKAFVVPMSSNGSAYKQAYGKHNLNGKRHLMRLGKLDGLHKESVLFLNDAKWINTARVIDIKAHIEKESRQFLEIKSRVMLCMQ